MSQDVANLYIKVDSKGVVTASKDLNELTGKSKETEKATDSVRQSFERLNKTFKIMGFVTIAAGLTATAYALRKSISLYADFEKELANVSTLVDTNIVSMQGLKKEILALPASLGSATELTKGLYQALSAGIEPAKSVRFVGEAAMAAKAGLSDAFIAVDAGTTLLNAFGIASSNSIYIFDLMFTTVKEGKTTFNELASTIGRISPIAAAANVSIEEMHAAIATLTKGGFATSEASSRLATALGSIIKPSSEAKKLSESLGLQFDATALKIKGLHKFLEDVTKATGGNVDQMALLFGGMESLSVMLALTGKQSQEFTNILNRMKNVSGATEEAFDKQKSTLSALWDTFKNTLSKEAILIGERLAPSIIKIIEKMSEWLEANRDFINQKLDKYLKDLPDKVDSVLDSIESIIDFYQKTPGLATGGLAAFIIGGPMGFAAVAAGTAGLSAIWEDIFPQTASEELNDRLNDTTKRIQKLKEMIKKTDETGGPSPLKYFQERYEGWKQELELLETRRTLLGRTLGLDEAWNTMLKDRENAAAETLAAEQEAREAELKRIKELADTEEQRRLKEEEAKNQREMDAATEQARLEKEAAAIKKIREEWEQTARTLNQDITLGGLDYYGKKMEEIRIEAENLKEKFKELPSAEQADLLKKYFPDMDITTIDQAIALIDQYTDTMKEIAKSDYIADVTEEYDKLMASIDPAIEKSQEMKKVQDLLDKAVAAGVITTNQATEALKKYNDAQKEDNYIDKLAEATSYYQDLTGFEETYHEKMLELIEARRQAEIDAGQDVTAANEKARQAQNELAEEMYDKEIEHIKKQWAGYSDMFEGLSNLYDEDSSQRETLHKIALAFQIAEQAQLNITAIKAAAVAIANQGQGDPYTALARVVAMIGTMASVLASAGISFSGGSVTSSTSTAASTILGAEAGTGSESISNAYELLQDTYDMQYRELKQLNDSMKSLNQNISGLVANILQYGVADVSSWNIDTGTTLTGLASQWWVTGGISFVEKLVNSIFGGKTTTSIGKTGLYLGDISVSDLMNDMDVIAKSFAKVITTVSGGWFHSDTTTVSTKYQELSSSTTDLLTSIYADISNTLVALTTELGTDMATTLAYEFEEIKINLKGMDSDEINDTLSEYFSGIGDKAVEALFGTLLSGYQEVGEGLLETAVRLVSDKAIIVDMLEKTGQAFTGTVSQMIEFSETLIDLAGDLDTMQDSFESYYAAFIPEEQQFLDLQNDLTAVLGDLNLILPDTREGYRALVESLNLTTTAGQAAYVALLAYAEYADEYYSYLEDVASATDDLTDSLKSLYQTITDWLDNLTTSDLAPVQSEASWVNKYNTMLAAATAPGAEASAITEYLNYATEFLRYQQSYGTSESYQKIYDAVVADVLALQAQTGQLLGSYATGTNYVPQTGAYMLHEGEAVIPPPYANKSQSFDTDSLGKAIAKYIMESNGGSNGEITVNIPVKIDGREIGNVTAKQIKTNSDLQESIRRVH